MWSLKEDQTFHADPSTTYGSNNAAVVSDREAVHVNEVPAVIHDVPSVRGSIKAHEGAKPRGVIDGHTASILVTEDLHDILPFRSYGFQDPCTVVTCHGSTSVRASPSGL